MSHVSGPGKRRSRHDPGRLQRDCAARRVLPETLLKFERTHECPTQIVRDTCGPDLDFQLVFIPEEYGADSFSRKPIMEDTASRAIAIVGLGAILPDAASAPAFWENVKAGRYSISEVTKERWDPDLYYDPDPHAPDKTYSRIGGFVRSYEWDPVKWKLGIPPRVAEAMDGAQKWAVAGTREALLSYGYPGRPLDLERTAVILGNAMAGERHYLTALRISFPEFARELDAAPSFAALPPDVRARLLGRAARLRGPRLPGDHRGHDAGGAVQLHGRPRRQPVQLPRAELRVRRRLRLGHGRDERGRGRSRGRGVRRGGHGRHRPQHGRHRPT